MEGKQELSTDQIIEALFQQRDKAINDVLKFEKAIKVLRPDIVFTDRNESALIIDVEPLNQQGNWNSLFPSEDFVSPKVSFDEQILDMFKAIGGFVKMTNFIEKFITDSKSSKTDEEIKGKIRRMKRKGDLISIKFNGNYAYTYWGLKNWAKVQDNKVLILKDYFPKSDEITEDSTYEIIK